MALVVAGFLPLLGLWRYIMTNIANLSYRLEGAAEGTWREQLPFLERLVTGMRDAFPAFYHDAYHWMTLYITPDTPFLCPLLAALAGIGALLALRRWQRLEGAALLGGVAAFMLPGALSQLPTHPVRLIGSGVGCAHLPARG